MTLSRTFGSLHRPQVSKSVTALFNDLGIYRFCIAFAVIDFLDILDLLDFTTTNYLEKYGYALIILGFMAVYFLRWKKIDPDIAPILFLLFFVVTGLAFAFNFFVYGERQSYVSAFISPLVFAVAIFIPPNSIILDARKIIRSLLFLLTAGTVFYLIEAIVKPLGVVSSLTPLHEAQILKSMNCVLALCLSILTDRKGLALFVLILTAIALTVRPTSTLVLALICCVPIAVALRLRVSGFRPSAVLLGRAIAMTTLLAAVSIPLLLYFFFDDVATAIEQAEGYLKSDVIGGQSNTAFRFAILKFAFTAIENTSLWYGSALSGAHTVSLGDLPGWRWWFIVNSNGDASIHSDFVIVLVLMGLLGYTLFSTAFYLVLKSRFRELSRRNVPRSDVVLQAISIIAVVALIIYSSDEPYLGYYNHTHLVWMLLLISEVARKSKIVDSAGQRWQTIVPNSSTGRRFR